MTSSLETFSFAARMTLLVETYLLNDAMPLFPTRVRVMLFQTPYPVHLFVIVTVFCFVMSSFAAEQPKAGKASSVPAKNAQLPN